MNKYTIKEIIESKGWKDVEAVFDKHFDIVLETESRSVNEIGKRYLAMIMAKMAMRKAMNELKNIANGKEKKDIRYV